MARRSSSGQLHVYLNSRLVGYFRRQRTGAVDFQYAQDWLDWDKSSPVSPSLPLREDRFIGDRVLAVFDNLLPDNPGISSLVRTRTGRTATMPTVCSPASAGTVPARYSFCRQASIRGRRVPSRAGK